MTSFRVAAIVAMLFACPLYSAEAVPQAINDKAIVVAEGGNEFAIDLYNSLRAENAGNLFFCPYGISEVLAMSYAGARGETAEQIARVMRFSVPQDELALAFHSLRSILAFSDKASGFQLRIANRLWGPKGYHFVPQFMETTKSHFGAEMGLVNFKAAAATAKMINVWVDKQTDHRIPGLIGPGFLAPESRLVLTDAVYFKANWIQTFDRKLTSDDVFRSPGRQQELVPMMHQKKHFRYLETELWQILELPYAGRGKSMLILLPRKIDGLNDVEKALTGPNLQAWISRLQSREVIVHLPKFQLRSELDLARVLQKMGMGLPFVPLRADFSGICAREPLNITAVVQQSFVDVHEEGTEAAAATAVGMAMGGGGRPPPPVEFRADHPFLYLIRDDRTHCIIFMGCLVAP